MTFRHRVARCYNVKQVDDLCPPAGSFRHFSLTFHRPGTHLIRYERTQAASDGLQEETWR